MNKHRPTTGACVSRQVQVLALWRYNAIPPIQVQVQPSTVRTLTWLAGLATTHTSHTVWVGFTCPWLVVSWWSYILPGFPPVRFPFLPKHKQQHQRNIKIRIRVSCHSPDHRASSAQASHTIAIFVPATCIASPPYIRLLNRYVPHTSDAARHPVVTQPMITLFVAIASFFAHQPRSGEPRVAKYKPFSRSKSLTIFPLQTCSFRSAYQ